MSEIGNHEDSPSFSGWLEKRRIKACERAQIILNDALLAFSVYLAFEASNLEAGYLKGLKVNLPAPILAEDFLSMEGLLAIRGAEKMWGYQLIDLDIEAKKFPFAGYLFSLVVLKI